MNSIGSKLRALMDARGISENELSRRSGIPQPTINKLLNIRGRQPRAETLEPLARYFGISLAELRGDRVEDFPHFERVTDALEIALVRAYRDSDDQGKHLILTVAKTTKEATRMRR